MSTSLAMSGRKLLEQSLILLTMSWAGLDWRNTASSPRLVATKTFSSMSWMAARGFNDFFKPQTVGAKGTSRPKKRELKGFKALMNTLKEMDAARVAREFPNDTDRAEAAKKGFRKLSAMEVQANLQVTVDILSVSHFGCSIINADTAFYVPSFITEVTTTTVEWQRSNGNANNNGNASRNASTVA
jgi:hypothetical protein